MFLERLSSVSDRIEGAVALSIVAADGMPVESVSASPELDLETIAAELVTLARSIAKEQRELSVGELRQFTVAGDRLTFVLSRVASHFWLLAALAPNASLGRARFELKRAELLFEDDLD
jgi:predicted regulator of Ras-like GTPase activity (Roadblock/LC7/MglB family)